MCKRIRMNGGAKDPLVDQSHVFLKGENMKKLTHLFFVVLTLLPFAATPVQTHAQETYTIKAEQHATTEVVPELPSISRIPVTTQEPDPHNAALVPLTGGVSFSSFLSFFCCWCYIKFCIGFPPCFCCSSFCYPRSRTWL